MGSGTDDRLGKAEAVARGIPEYPVQRDRLYAAVRSHVLSHELVPPLTMDEIQLHARAVALAENALAYLDFLMVLVGSEVWRDTVAALPFDRRILLLPQCLRNRSLCRARVDAFGVLCEGCGACDIGPLQEEAEALGYIVLIAEGTTLVTQLLEQGQVDAVIGVSCLEALEKSFPHLAAEAIPGMAVPLNRDGCVDTAVDVDRVRELIHLRTDGARPGIDVEALRETVESWFTDSRLSEIMDRDGSAAERLAVEWLSRSGKRWRPFLSVCVYRALCDSPGPIPETMRRIALAVECFHKASLLHDDIEDGDSERYGVPVMHVTHGVPTAINVGDLLVGEGYRLLSECGLPAPECARLLLVAAEGHRTLAVGQGEELAWRSSPVPPSLDWVLDVFTRKTAPAFSVALQLGAVHAGAGDEVLEVLKAYSRALGIAFQIKDDLDDGIAASATLDFLEPSILIALAFQEADEYTQAAVADGLKQHGEAAETALATLRELSRSEAVHERAVLLFDHYRNEAIRSLCGLRNSELKRLLRRVVARILGNERT